MILPWRLPLNLISNSSFCTRPRLSQSLQTSVNPARYSTCSVWDTTEVRPQIPASRSHLRYLATCRETPIIALLSALTARQDAQKASAQRRERLRTGSTIHHPATTEFRERPRQRAVGVYPRRGRPMMAGTATPLSRHSVALSLKEAPLERRLIFPSFVVAVHTIV